MSTAKFAGVVSPVTLTDDVDDYAPPGLADANIVRLSGDDAHNITGLLCTGVQYSRVIWFINGGAFDLTFKDGSSSSAFGNRFDFGGSDLVLPAGKSVGMWYDNSSSCWRGVVAVSSVAGSGSSNVKTAVVTLTDAQIKALPSTPVVIVPAPGAGKMIIPICATLDLTIVDAYDFLAGSSVNLQSDDGDYLSGGLSLESYLDQVGRFIWQFIIPYANAGTGDFVGEQLAGPGPISNDSPVKDTAISLADTWNGLSNYTGGGSNNSMKVTVQYVLIDI